MSTLKNILKNKDISCNAVWFMRQAGRYLPEFREIRKSNTNFIKLCLNSDLSSEITLQPIKRYNLDAAIIFSDILLVPYALGQNVEFVENKGPVLSEIDLNKFLSTSKKDYLKKLDPVYEAIKKTRSKLNKNKSLISFVGAPWTLLVYMFNLKEGNKDFNISKININKIQIGDILKKLIEFLNLHIEAQVKAGADIVQIFDSWAGFLNNENLENFCYFPNKELVKFCKKNKILNICFPKGIRENYKKFNEYVRPDCLNLDYEISPEWAKENLKNVAIQGGMNPKILFENQAKIEKEAKRYLDIFRDVPYIFNLGHGLTPKTDPEKVGKLVKFIKEYKNEHK
tara:strand:+ start:305 stop:1327 length:1023 start_codon:yes stop_codon:yes gene_type:complete